MTEFMRVATSMHLTVRADKGQLLAPVALIHNESGFDCNALNTSLQDLQTTQGLPQPVVAAKVLGTYIGEEDLVRQHLTHKVRAQQTTFDRIANFADVSAQVALLLLRTCVNKANTQIARLASPVASEQALMLHDDFVERTLAHIVREDRLPELTVQQIQLPLNKGGLGLTRLAEIRKLAYLSSVTNTIAQWRNFIPDKHPFLVHWLRPPEPDSVLQHCLTVAHEIISVSNANKSTIQTSRVLLPSTTADLISFKNIYKMQHNLTTHYTNVKFAQFVSQLDTRQKAAFNASCADYASSFLQTIPSEPALTLTNNEMFVGLSTYLHLPLVQKLGGDPTKECHCNTEGRQCNDQHVFNCRGNAIMTKRHEAIANNLRALLQHLNLTPKRELKCSLNPRDTHRYDISLDNFKNLAHFNVDVTVVNALREVYLAGTSTEPGHAAQRAESAKNRKYSRFTFVNEQFLAFAVEVQGGLGKRAVEFLKHLSFLAADTPPEGTTWATSTFMQWATQTTSCTLIKANTANLMDTIAFTKRAHSSGYLKAAQLAIEDEAELDDVLAAQVDDYLVDEFGNELDNGDAAE